MFLFPFLEKSKKLLKWTGEHLTTPVNLDEHGATRNMKKAWRIATFLYIGELRWQMFNGSPKRKAVCSNHIGDASALSRKVSHEIFRVFANKKRGSIDELLKNGLFI